MVETPNSGNPSEPDQQQPDRSLLTKLIVLAVLAGVGGVLYWQFGELFSWEKVAAQESRLLKSAREQPAVVLGAAFLIYVAVTACAVPAATLITLTIGWLCKMLYGELTGVLIAVAIVSFASTAGATLSFLMSRFLFRDAIQRRFGDRLQTINEALKREGAFYLFTLRLIPVVPFFVINVVMGLTSIRVRTFWWVSQVGMLAGTFVYVFAGSAIPSIEQIVDRSQLRAEEIDDLPGFLRQLWLSSNDGAEPAAHRIWELLPKDARQAIATSADGGELDQEIVLRGLNEAIKRPELSLAKEWPDEALNPNEVSALNRKLLERTFSAHILPAKPILSINLFVAFTLLGLFPLLLKKLMARLRPTPSEPTG